MSDSNRNPRLRWRPIVLSAAIAAWTLGLALAVYARLTPGGQDRNPDQVEMERKHALVRAKLRLREQFAGMEKQAAAGDLRMMLRVGFGYERGIMGAPKDARRAFKWRLQAANAGAVGAMMAVARDYEAGIGTAPDAYKAVDWYRRAAQEGNRDAARKLGDFYNQGTRIPAEPAEGFRWYGIAADEGDADAAEKIAACYETGRGVPQDLTAAYYAYARLAESGRTSAELKVASMLQKGIGVDADESEAVRWLRAAAQEGNSRAIAELGSAYLRGRGVERDPTEARRLLQRAAAAGEPMARVELSMLDQTSAAAFSSPVLPPSFTRQFGGTGNLSPLPSFGPLPSTVPASASSVPALSVTQPGFDSPAEAKARLAETYLRAHGATKADYARARALFAEAAEEGSVPARTKHALMVKNGVGGPMDVRAGTAELKAAARLFEPMAMTCLAAAMIRGDPKAGVACDPAAAAALIDRIPENVAAIAAWKKRALASSPNPEPARSPAPAAASESPSPDHGPTPFRQPAPEYPIELRFLDVDGEVTVDFIVDKAGHVVNPFAVRSTIPGFETAAVAAVARWQFNPGVKDGRPVYTHLQVPIVFALHGDKTASSVP